MAKINHARPDPRAPGGRVILPEVEPERRALETRPAGRGSKVGARRVNALPPGARGSGLTPYAIYAMLTLAIMLPMLGPGYIFALDMAFTPQLPLPEQMSSSYLFHAGLHYLNLVIPSQILQKLLLAGTLLLSGLGMHALVRHIQKTKNGVHPYDAWARYIAGVLYMINPFTYSRFMTGQYAVLLGYALLPFLVRAVLQFLAVPTLARALQVSGWAIAISIVSIHTLGLAVVMGLIGLGVFAWRHRLNRTILCRYGTLGLASGLLFVAASGYWLFPLLAGQSNQGQAIAQFTASDRAAFATTGADGLSKLGNILQLQGFWAEGQGMYLLPANQLPGWLLVVLAVWILVGIGARWLWRRQRAITVLLLGTAVAATGIAIVGLPEWPLLRGYREPHKFVALVALGYAVFAGLGAGAVLAWFSKRAAFPLAAVLILLVPVLFTPTMFWAFSGQLVPRQYPADWFIVNNRLNQDPGDFAMLFLPWHLYMRFEFAGRVIVNPADKFFDKPTIINNELEYAGAAPTFPDSDKKRIGALLAATPKTTNLGQQLADFNIKYIVLAKAFDYEKYSYLDTQTDLQPVMDTPNLRVYRSTAYEGF